VELEILFVGLATGFAAGVGAATWWGMRAARAERREEERRPGGESRFGLLAWTGNTITARGTAREVVPAEMAGTTILTGTVFIYFSF
jgi:hypothetical protein